MRAIRGSACSPARSDEIDFTKQPPQLSENLKSLLARQGAGGDFGSLISPLPSSKATGNSATAAAYQWTPFHIYQSSEMPAYLDGLNRVDYCTLREQLTWAPLPIAPPPSSNINHTPPQAGRSTSPERSSSTVSSASSGLSMSHLSDLLAQLNVNDSPMSTAASVQGQHNRHEPAGHPEWSSIYQMRHGPRALPPPSMESIPASSSTPPGTSSSSPSNSPPDYAALLLAAASYFHGGVGGHPGNMSQCDPRFRSAGDHCDPRFRSPGDHCDPRFRSPGDHCDPNSPDQQYSIERAARIYRKAATICDATCTWSGQLPAHLAGRTLHNQAYSCKVFVGGVPWDVTEQALLGAFSPFGPVRVEWPGKEARYARSPVKPSAKGKGYVYMIYESDRSVKALLENCVRDYSHGGEYYYQLTSRRLRAKEIRQVNRFLQLRVQIIPWNISDSNHIRCSSQRLDPKKTVFVGALHGMITAEVLCNVMNDLFSGVVYAGIDTDKYKYPIGSGRVTFNNTRSYHKAISAAFVEIKSAKFSKKVQIDPYLEDATCSNCLTSPGPYFCREFMCFRYFCKACWHNQHALDVMQSHKPLMRNTRRTLQMQAVSSIFANQTGPQF